MIALITPYWDSITLIAAVTGVIAMGLYISSSAGALSVAHAALAGIGGYLGGVLTTNFAWAFVPALVAGGLAGALTGLLLGVLILRMNPLVAGLTTLAFGETAVVIAYNIKYIGGGSSFYGVPPYTTLTVALIAIALAAVIGWRFDRSRLGRSALAVRDDDTAAAAMGINVNLTRLAVFTLGAGIAGVGGALRVHYILVQRPEDLGFFESLSIVIIWAVGGSYTFWGPIAGAFVLTFVPELLRFSAEQRFMVYGLLLAAVVISRPDGMIRRLPDGQRPDIQRLLRRVGLRRGGPDVHPVKASGDERPET